MAIFQALFGDREGRRAAQEMYVRIVRQARNPDFYTECGVADSLDGRFDMIVLHLFLVLHRFPREEREHPHLRQLYDTVIADMDSSLREIGVGDLSVPKKIKRMARAAMGRLEAYEAALGDVDAGAVRAALVRNVYRGESPAGPGPDRLAAYVRAAAAALEVQAVDEILQGAPVFPAPAATWMEDGVEG